uniref:Cytochrome c biogenesis protein CcsB n=1 Tax=Dasya binghamiae TaxID=1896963 RepID=A0A1C8XRT8_9FLOR|nr:cytochrome c biogenesis protein ccs1 [Dasya binghamiae]AOH77208.1 cytochrome c biogenesis protein ccs1 [Dasya binghamiae]
MINLKNTLWNFMKSFANLNFSIFILFFISFCIMLGSIIQQDQNLGYYQTYYPINNRIPLSLINWRVILYFGLDHLYQTWWFISILIVFALSLMICTLSIQLPSLKHARRWKFFNPSKNSSLIDSFVQSSSSLKNSYINIIYSLVYSNFYVFHKKHYIYAYKGIIGRISPVFVHISIVLTLLGSICSSFFGYTAQEMIPRGEIFHTKNITRSGLYSKLNTNFLFRVDEFYIDYNFDNSIKQFFSTLSLFNNNGQKILNQTISVNSPLKFNGLTVYQTDWDINSIRLSIGFSKNLIFQKKLIKINLNNKVFWLCKIPISDNKEIFIIFFDLKTKFLISNFDGSIVDSVFIKEKFYLDNILLSIQDIILDTGLQIKVDPGVQVIYFSFFILMLSTMLSYISYCQIWITIIADILNFSGSTNRAIFFFEEDISKVNQIYNRYTYILGKIKTKENYL